MRAPGGHASATGAAAPERDAFTLLACATMAIKHRGAGRANAASLLRARVHALRRKSRPAADLPSLSR